jgi:DNA recombination protein RmuC
MIDSEKELDSNVGIRNAEGEASKEPGSPIQADVGDVRSRLGNGESVQTGSAFGAIDPEEPRN